ncbi:methyltransferase [Paucibacter sp. APW11]|uniref:Methyltransferase n=1 Tax=Roseateles aquae TaxID=3077235 RepID=A0ABU3PIL6_9BURK|nr:methyltransferase [Paucibacter sp. APW11]MDT9002411.1 methyltransferase [Paucibacter sp. APW11]
MSSLQKQSLQAWAFGWAAALANRLQRLPNRLAPPPFRLIQIGSAFWQSRALHAAAELDIATLLGEQTLAIDTLAERAGAQADGLQRLLRFLAAIGIFELVAPGQVRNNRLSQPLRRDRPGSVRSMVLMHNSPAMSRPWYESLSASLRDGSVPFERCHGQSLYSHMDAKPEMAALFARAMDEVEALSGDSFATAFDWSRFRRLIDVGGSRGAKSAAILRRHPQLQALVIDRPVVVQQARDWWAAQPGSSCRERLQFEPGDLLSGPLPGARDAGDVYLLSAVLHGLDDGGAEALLRRLAHAVGSSGATVVLMELLMPEQGGDISACSFDMQMLMGTRGRIRTPSQWRSLLARAGMQWQQTVQLASFAQMLVLRPQA